MKLVLATLLLAGACATHPRKHVERAIEALGGIERLRSARTVLLETQGTFAGRPFTTVTHARRPDRFRRQTEFGKGRFDIRVLGEEAYLSLWGRTNALSGRRRRTALIHARAALLGIWPDLLLGDKVVLERGKPVEIDGRSQRVVDAYFSGETRPITLVFDRDTKLLRRITSPVWDEELLDWVRAVTDIGDYRQTASTGGLLLAHHRSTMDWDRRMVIEETVSTVAVNPEIGPATFAAPRTQPPRQVKLRRVPTARCAVYTFRGPAHEAPDALARVMAWIGAQGGQPAGPPSMLFKTPTNYRDPSRNEIVIQVPVQMGGAPRDGDIRLLERPPFLFAYLRYEGPAPGVNNSWATVYEWCRKNNCIRTGARRVTTLKMDEKTGVIVAEVGFPVREQRRWR